MYRGDGDSEQFWYQKTPRFVNSNPVLAHTIFIQGRSGLDVQLDQALMSHSRLEGTTQKNGFDFRLENQPHTHRNQVMKGESPPPSPSSLPSPPLLPEAPSATCSAKEPKRVRARTHQGQALASTIIPCSTSLKSGNDSFVTVILVSLPGFSLKVVTFRV